MKKPSDQIFRLIRSMTPAEKRFFKRHFASEQSVLTQLFDFINKMKTYDESLIKKRFDERVAKNLKVYKVQLFDLLMDSLQALAGKKNIKTRIRKGIEEVDILLNKQLYDLGADRLKKLKNLCLKYEEYTYLIEILFMEFFIHHITIDQIGISEHPIFTEVPKYLQKLDQHIRLSYEGHRLMDMQREKSLSGNQEDPSELQKLLESTEINDPSMSFQSKLTRQTIISFIASITGDQEKLGHSQKACVNLFEQFPHFKDTMSFRYIGAMRNYLNFCVRSKQYVEVRELITTTEAYVKKNPDMLIHLIHFYYAEVQMYYDQYAFCNIDAEVEQRILQHLKTFNIEHERIAMLVYFYLLLNQLIKANFTQVHFYLRKLEAAIEHTQKGHINLLNIFEIICAYEEQDEEQLERAWQKAKKLKEQGPSYCEMLDLTQGLLQQPFDKKAHFENFVAKISTFENDPLWETVKFFKLDEWLWAHQNRQSFSEWMLQKQKKAERISFS